MVIRDWRPVRPGTRDLRAVAGVATAGALLLLAPLGAAASAPAPDDPSPNVSVVATGLNNPRGLKFGPDGDLYVAEGGTGGTATTDGQCEQVPPPVGPYMGGMTGRISKISADGTRTTVADGLPSDETGPDVGSDKSSVADVEFIDGTLYALLAGGGCSHGNAGTSNGVLRVSGDGSWTTVANLSEFYMANPVAHPSPPDFEPDGDPYSMMQVNGDLYVVESNHGELDKVATSGQITRVADISATQFHTVPTAMTYHNGAFYIGTLLPFPPTTTGEAKILKVTPDGQVSVAASGLTTVLGVAFDKQGQMYALESVAEAGPMPTPGSGRVVRVSSSGGLEPVATGLTVPTAMILGPDGDLYVSNIGYGPGEGAGQIVKISLTAAAPPAAATPVAPAAPSGAGAPSGPTPAHQAPAPQMPAGMPNTGDGSTLPTWSGDQLVPVAPWR